MEVYFSIRRETNANSVVFFISIIDLQMEDLQDRRVQPQ